MKRRKSKVVQPTGSEVIEALLALFAMTDAVFTEDDALAPGKRQMTVGRLYEEWKCCRAILDPQFNPDNHDKPSRYGSVRKGISQRASG